MSYQGFPGKGQDGPGVDSLKGSLPLPQNPQVQPEPSLKLLLKRMLVVRVQPGGTNHIVYLFKKEVAITNG